MRYFFYLITFFTTFLSQCQESVDILNEEFQAIKRSGNFPFEMSLEIIEKGNIVSLPSGKIRFSKEQLRKITTNIKNKNLRQTLRLLLAHEIGHQYQFHHYKNKKELDNNAISKMLLEAQADILAGYSWAYSFFSEYFLQGKHKDIQIDDMYELFQFMLELGIQENTIGTHPSKNDRLMSMRLGINIGLIELTYYLAKINPNPFIKEFGSIEKFYEAGNLSRKKYDFDKNTENLFTWSYRMAKKIVNSNPSVTKNIVLYKDPNAQLVKWNTSADSPFVEYNLEYLNISQKPIYVEMEVYTSHVDRVSKYSTIYHNIRNSDIFKFTIKPKEIKTISGVLRWDKDDLDRIGVTHLKAKEMPKIVFPNSESYDAWISCEFVDQNSIDNSSPEIIEFLSASPVKDVTEFKIGAKINQLIRNLKFTPDKLAIGIGNLSVYDQTKGMTEIRYNSTIQFDKNTKTKIIRYFNSLSSFTNPQFEENEIEITYSPILDKNLADRKFQFILRSFRNSLVGFEEQSDFTDPTYLEVNFHKGDLSVDVYLESALNKELNKKLWYLGVDIYY